MDALQKTLKICTLKSQHNYYRNANQNYQTQDGYKITAQIESISKSVEKSGAKYISGDYTVGQGQPLWSTLRRLHNKLNSESWMICQFHF